MTGVTGTHCTWQGFNLRATFLRTFTNLNVEHPIVKITFVKTGFRGIYSREAFTNVIIISLYKCWAMWGLISSGCSTLKNE